MREIAKVTNGLTSKTFPPLIEAGATLTGSTLRPDDGQFPLERIAAVAPVLEDGAKGLGAAADSVGKVDSPGLIGPVARPLELLRSKLREAASVADSSADVARLMPGLLGAKGKRRYLVAFLNNAEPRSRGGIAGAFAVISADRGRLVLERTAAARDFEPIPPTSVTPLSEAETATFSDEIGRYPQNAPAVPDFPRSATLLLDMWQAAQGDELDGVLSLDPVAISYLLRATGEIEVDGRSVRADNAVRALLSDTYRELPTDAEQNKFFADVTEALFSRLAKGRFDPGSLARGLAQGVGEHRVALFSRNRAEELRLAAREIGGQLPLQASDRPHLGVYVNDAARDKLGYYLRFRTDVSGDRCFAGAQRLTVTTTLRSSVPHGDLPTAVRGRAEPGLLPGQMRLTIYNYAPIAGRIDSVSVDGVELPLNVVQHLNRPVGSLTLDIPRGGVRTIDYVMYSGRGQAGRPEVTTTPGLGSSGIGTVGGARCTNGG